MGELTLVLHNWNDGMMEYWNNGYDSRHYVEKYNDSWDMERHRPQKHQ
jgi:hypothetical protein